MVGSILQNRSILYYHQPETDNSRIKDRESKYLLYASFLNQSVLTDEQVLEAILALAADHSVMQSDNRAQWQNSISQQAAKTLLRRYLTLDGVVKAPSADLATICGVGLAGAALLKAVNTLMSKTLQAKITGRSILTCWDDLVNYLRATLVGERVESFHVLFLDGSLCLIADEEIARGTIDHVNSYPREIVRRCLELDAAAVIVVHNHPTGHLAPSVEDRQVTASLSKALALFDTTIIDHVIVGPSGFLSFRMENLLTAIDNDDGRNIPT